MLDSIAQLARADREQRGAFVRDERTLVVWADAFDELVPAFEELEDKLIALVWRERPRLAGAADLPPSYSNSMEVLGLDEKGGELEEDPVQEKLEMREKDGRAKEQGKSSWWSWKLADGAKGAAEKAAATDIEQLGTERRPVRLYAAVYSGAAVALTICRWLDVLGWIYTYTLGSLHR